jgi:hypothetical protein
MAAESPLCSGNYPSSKPTRRLSEPLLRFAAPLRTRRRRFRVALEDSTLPSTSRNGDGQGGGRAFGMSHIPSIGDWAAGPSSGSGNGMSVTLPGVGQRPEPVKGLAAPGRNGTAPLRDPVFRRVDSGRHRGFPQERCGFHLDSLESGKARRTVIDSAAAAGRSPLNVERSDRPSDQSHPRKACCHRYSP